MLVGNMGEDFISGGKKDDTVWGGAGVDDLWGDGLDSEGEPLGNGNDMIEGGAGADSINGGMNGAHNTMTGTSGATAAKMGGDTVLYGASDAGVTITLGSGAKEKGGHAEGDELTGIEHVTGSMHDDEISGSDDVRNKLVGGQGDDEISGGDEEFAMNGDGMLVNADGVAITDADGEYVTVGDELADDDDRQPGNGDVIWGGQGDDTLMGGEGRDMILGGADDDEIMGDGGDDMLMGGDGKDELMGGTGNDVLMGGDGDDMLMGGDGADTLDGGAGKSTLDGGTDTGDAAGRSDVFVFGAGATNSKILNFDDNDVIDLSDLNLTTADVTLAAGSVTIDGSAIGASADLVITVTDAAGADVTLTVTDDVLL